MKKMLSYLPPVICSICMLLVYIWNPLSVFNYTLVDLMFQRPEPPLENLCVIGIDDKSLREIGPWQTWSRTRIADLITMLNEDPANRPAVIGVNIMYFGSTGTDEDIALAEAAKSGNTVFASEILYDEEVNSDNSGKLYKDSTYITDLERPFKELTDSCSTGFTNMLQDKDGYVRDSLLSVTHDGQTEYNFAYQVYLEYAEATGITPINTPPTDRDNTWYIPYSVKPNTYGRGLSYVDVMDGKVPTERFRDAIVIIGPYASGMLESYYTPIDKTGTMYCSEILANMVQACIQGEFEEAVPLPVQFLLVLLSVLTCMYLFKKTRIGIASLILLLFTIGYLALTLAAYYNGYIFRIIYIPLFALLLYGHRIIKNFHLEIEQKKEILNTFKRYVAPEFVDDIIKQSGSLAASKSIKREIAVLFVDIRGFTSMSEALPAETVVDILNECLTLTSTMIFQNGGTLDKFIGDATMALFNAPLVQDDYLYKAAKTAYDIISHSAELEETLSAKFGQTIQFGIGINCGEAVIGSIGAPSRMDYTAIGDTVNTASRLESHAKPGQILISQQVYEQLEGRIISEQIGALSLKGKQQPVTVYQLTGLIDPTL